MDKAVQVLIGNKGSRYQFVNLVINDLWYTSDKDIDIKICSCFGVFVARAGDRDGIHASAGAWYKIPKQVIVVSKSDSSSKRDLSVCLHTRLLPSTLVSLLNLLSV